MTQLQCIKLDENIPSLVTMDFMFKSQTIKDEMVIHLVFQPLEGLGSSEVIHSP